MTETTVHILIKYNWTQTFFLPDPGTQQQLSSSAATLSNGFVSQRFTPVGICLSA